MLFSSTVAFNGLSLTTVTSLADTGANGFLFISVRFAKKVKQRLKAPSITGFKPHYVGGFDGQSTQVVDVLLPLTFSICGRTMNRLPFIVLDMKYDIIIGKQWFEKYRVMIDPANRRLVFPEDSITQSNYDIPMDRIEPPIPDRDGKFKEDIKKRQTKMDKKDKRDRDGNHRKMKILSRSEAQKVSASSPQETTPEPILEQHPRKLKDPESIRMQIQARIKELESNVESDEETLVGSEDSSDDETLVEEKPVKRVTFALPHHEIGPQKRSTSGRSPEEREMEEELAQPYDMEYQELLEQELERLKEKEEKLDYPEKDAQGPYRLARGFAWYKERPPDIAVVAATTFHHLSKDKENLIGETSLHEIDKAIEEKRDPTPLQRDEAELRKRVRELVPKVHHDYLDVFSKADSDELAPHRPRVDHRIELTGKTEDLKFSPLYKMSLEELEAARKYLTESLKKGFITPSSAPWAAPVLLARKASGGLRFCVDYRRLNALTKKDRYPLPLIEETLARISKAKIFTKIDIRQAFHRIRMHPDDEDLTTFRTRYGAYKYKVLPFGLTNGPATFQRYINETLFEYLDDFCSAYIDDILIFSENKKDHEQHVNKVLERLRKAHLQADLDKCEFHVTHTKFLGFIIGTDGIAVDPSKIAVLKDWKVPKNVKEVQSFLGFCNFYRKFVRDYGRIARPLTELTRKEELFDMTTERRMEAFEELKERLVSAPILRHFSYDLETRVETDASDGVVAGVLLQRKSEDEDWHPTAYYSENMQGAEFNYGIHDKELMAVVRALRVWRPELIGLRRDHPFTIVTDHKALEYFGTKQQLNLRQAGWAEFLSQFHFVITYRPGSENVLADILSRKSDELKTQKEKRDAMRTMTLFQPVPTDTRMMQNSMKTEDVTMIEHPLCSLDETKECTPIFALDEEVPLPDISGMELIDKVLEANARSPQLEVHRAKAQDPASHADDHGFTMSGRLVLFKGRLIVPDEENLRTMLLTEVHCRLTTGHPGRTKTRKLVAARYWWPGWALDTQKFVDNCYCKAAKNPTDKTPGLLHPLPVPLRPWSNIAMDFHSLPMDKYGHDNVFVIVDRLGKRCWSIPCTRSATAKDAALMFYNGPFRIHGPPQSIVSDRGPQFIADFMNELSKIFGINWKLSSAGHSQTAGQVEIMNRYIDQRLRLFVNHHQDNWSMALPAIDYIQASLVHESTGLSPHEVEHGFPMPQPFDWAQRTEDFKDMPAREKLNRQEAQTMADTFKQFQEHARASMKKAQERMCEQANKHRRIPDFAEGDRVYIIKKKGTSTDRPSDKLDYPMTRNHYKILGMANHSYRLELPASWKGSRTFHANRLRKFPNNPLPRQLPDNPKGKEVDPNDEEKWKVDKVSSARIFKGKLQYQVQWKNWDPDPEWYDAENFKNSPLILKKYHDENPEQAGPPKQLNDWRQATEADEFEPPHKDDNAPVAQSAKGLKRKRKIG